MDVAHTSQSKWKWRRWQQRLREDDMIKGSWAYCLLSFIHVRFMRITRPFKVILLCCTANFYRAEDDGIINQKFSCGKDGKRKSENYETRESLWKWKICCSHIFCSYFFLACMRVKYEDEKYVELKKNYLAANEWQQPSFVSVCLKFIKNFCILSMLTALKRTHIFSLLLYNNNNIEIILYEYMSLYSAHNKCKTYRNRERE